MVISRAVVQIATGIGLSISFWAVVVLLREQIGVAVWQNDLFLTIGYGLVVFSAVIANVEGARRWQSLAAWFAVAASFVVAAAGVAGQPLPAGVLLALSVHLLAVLVFRGVARGSLGSWRNALATLTFAWVLWAALSAVWIQTTAPAYAEGFVLLTLWLLGTFTFLSAVAGFLLARSAREACGALRAGRIAILLVGAGLILTGSIIYMLWAEGDDRPALAAVPERADVFIAPAGAAGNSEANAAKAAQFRREDVIAMLQSKPRPSLSQLGNLALLSGDRRWAAAYREGLLGEVASDALTGPANSVKFGQYNAMLRGLFFLEISRVWPELFSAEEQERIAAWFSRIMQRAFTVEWVDLLYAIPFRDLPEGPYLNQEVGAGSLSVLRRIVNTEELRSRATSFLDRKGVGWRGNFRNGDDSLQYQDVWISNAYALWRYADGSRPDKAPGAQLSVDWLKEQLLRAPVPLNYGLVGPFRPLDSLSIAAFALRDKEARWLLDQHLTALREGGESLPGDLAWLWLWDDSIPAVAPSLTSKALNGITGYSFRPGSLAPDKLVFRDENDPELFALFGLRNRGWHRYPATGSLIALFYGDFPAVTERIVRLSHKWLPAGRAKHRDKKVDRMSLNGPMVARTGLDAWIGGVSGVYSRWSQATPAFAPLDLFVAADDLQVARMDLGDWSGIAASRTVVVGDDGWLVVWDQLDGSAGLARAANWNLVGYTPTDLPGMFVKQPGSGGRVTFLHDGEARVKSAPIRYPHPPAWPAAAPDRHVLVQSRASLRTAAVFQLDEQAIPATGRIGDAGAELSFGEDEVLVLGTGGEAQTADVVSDAAVIHRRRTPDGIRYRLFDLTYVDVDKTAGCISALRTLTAEETAWRADAEDTPSAFHGRLDVAAASAVDFTVVPCAAQVSKE
jgi:hypothetical protein